MTNSASGIVLMNRRAGHGVKRQNLVSRDDWEAIMQDFSPAVRGRAANLAAHNYDVTLIGDRILISTCSGGAFFAKDGTRTDLTTKQWDALYPKVEPDPATYNRAYYNATSLPDGSRRAGTIVEAALRTLALELTP